MVAREDRRGDFLAGLLVLLNDDLRVVLDDPREAERSKHLPPEEIGHYAVEVRRIAGPVVEAPVEGKEPGGSAFELSAKSGSLVVEGEVGDGPAEREQRLTGVPVALILLYRVLDRLVRDVVLQLEREDRKSIHERDEVDSVTRVAHAVMHLP